MLHPAARQRIEQWLQQRRFGRLFPGWRVALRFQRGLFDAVQRGHMKHSDVTMQHALLDRIGI
ncbi:MAG: hypothetical protein IT370_16370 [Deltaproteobacteria bacterium]|nr:hypothetical protein [Deltaproteobacteria bacterium]